MHIANNEIRALELKVENLAIAEYGTDATYVTDMKKAFREANGDWAKHRDSDCLSEQYLDGASRGREFGDLVEQCRLRLTRSRIEKLKQYVAGLETLEGIGDVNGQ